MPSLKVMTFNLRFDNPEDGVNRWPFRRACVVETILREQPDLLATQEGMRTQLRYLSENLNGYQAAVKWRHFDPGPMDQCPTIFFRTKGLRPKTGGEFWLSETPYVHRSKSWGSAFPRLFTSARFLHLPSRKGFWFGNTHLDHVSERARDQGARLIARWARRKRLPVVLAGDFNAPPDSKVHQILTYRHGGLRDTWRVLKGPKAGDLSTVHHFTGKPAGGRIDWILVSCSIQVTEARIVDGADGDLYPSDHFAYIAAIEIP
jgi:endonuclease/exonuclease/phosphatase family metal-dependent hydrolase